MLKLSDSILPHTFYVSIIVPVHNEAPHIEICLLSIVDQTYPLECVELLIVDGLSTDGTRNIICDFITHNSQISIHTLDNPGKIVPTGMNIALRQAKGDIIIRVDGHCIIAPDYVRKCVEHIQTDGVDGVGGPMESIGITYLSKVISIGMSSPFGVGNSAFRTQTGQTKLVDTVPFPAYTRQIIERVGLYDEELVRNQDDEYNYRIRELGGKILLADDVRSKYFSRSSLRGLWRQYFQYGYWKVRVLQKHPRQMSLRQFVPPLFVLSLIASAILLVFPFPSLSLRPALTIPLLYILVNLTASTYTAYKRDYSALPLLPLVFMILHVSYGLGFLVGLIKFANRWGDKIGKVPSFQQRTG